MMTLIQILDKPRQLAVYFGSFPRWPFLPIFYPFFSFSDCFTSWFIMRFSSYYRMNWIPKGLTLNMIDLRIYNSPFILIESHLSNNSRSCRPSCGAKQFNPVKFMHHKLIFGNLQITKHTLLHVAYMEKNWK